MTQSNENTIEKLCKIVHDNPQLQAKLFAYHYRDQFIEEVMRLAKDSGLDLNTTALANAMQEGYIAWRNHSQN